MVSGKFDEGAEIIVASSGASAAEPIRERLFRQVTAKCSGLIARIALTHEADHALRRELIQDILLAIWLALPSFRGESSLRTFVARIAQRRSVNHVVKQAREPRRVELPQNIRSGALLPDEVALEKDRKRQLAECIERLPLAQREAILLCFEGFSYAEIGEVLGITANAAMLRCQRAKAALRSIIDEIG